PQIILKRRNLPADRRLAHAEFFGGMGEAARLGGGVENPEFVPVEHVVLTLSNVAGCYSAASASSCSARKRSASSAAMQPMPAATGPGILFSVVPGFTCR